MGGREDLYDLVLIGNYTKDTIVSASGTRVVDGGGFNYGAHAAVLAGLRVATVTRLAREDSHIVSALEDLGVSVFPTFTPSSTHLRLEYPSADVDERTITVTHSAGPFGKTDVQQLQARAFLINASFRGEVGLELIKALKAKNAILGADVQGFVRSVSPDGRLTGDEWEEKEEVLSRIDILKTDAVEAEILTGETDIRSASHALKDLGPREIVLTHRDGILVLSEGTFHQAPFLPRELVGRSGRGDTCMASYLSRRLTASPQEATIWAAAVTSLKLEKEGPVRRSAEEVEKLIKCRYCT